VSDTDKHGAYLEDPEDVDFLNIEFSGLNADEVESVKRECVPSHCSSLVSILADK
jgi:hypothetical protein